MSIVNPQDLYRCPQCGLVDRVVRARASDKVKPPVLHLAEPRVYESPWGCFSIGFIPLAFAAFLFFLVIFLWYASVSAKAASDVVPGLLVTLTLAVIAVLVIIHHVQKAKTSRAEIARYNAALEVENEAVRQRFKQDEEVYENKLYYCERDDVVFILGKPNTCIPAYQIEYLYGA